MSKIIRKYKMTRKFSLTVLIVLNSFVCFGKSTDTLLQFSVNNEELFWMIVSKNYSFSHCEIEQYKDDIAFFYLSGNENIDWTKELIKQYELLLNFESVLQRNKGVNWQESLIGEFLDRDWLNWSELYFDRELTISRALYETQKRNFISTTFLIKETPDSVTFYFEHDYLRRNRLFEDYLLHWYRPSDSTRVRHYNELKQYFGREISDVPLEVFLNYHRDFNWHNITQFADLNWTWKKFISMFPYLRVNLIPQNKSIYDQLFKTTIDSFQLASLTHKFHKSTRFYKLEKARDKYGSTPRVILDTPIFYDNIQNVFNFPETFPDSIDNFKYEIGHTYEGPKRFVDVLFFERGSGFSGFLCSGKTKSILESFNIPNHAFYPITVYLNSQWYGQDTASYYLFVVNNSSLLKDIIPESTKLKSPANILEPFESDMPDSLEISSKSQFLKFLNHTYHFRNYRNKKLALIHLETFFDLQTIKDGEIYISRRLKDALVNGNISGLGYQKDYTLNWVFENDNMSEVLKKDFEDFQHFQSFEQQKTTKLYDKAKERQRFLASNHGFVAEAYENLVLNELDSAELYLIKKEIKWDAIIPEEYRKYLLPGKKFNLGREFREYDLLPLAEIRQVSREWYKYVPQTYKGLLIAGNGLGDYLGLILLEDSNYKLDNTIYRFEHETGEVIKSIKLESD